VEELPNGRLRWIEECGHVPHLEQPEETADAILSFLTSSDVGSATTSASKEGGKSKQSVDGQQGNDLPAYYIGGGVLGAFLLEELIKQFF
jgi:hypothetical protein